MKKTLLLVAGLAALILVLAPTPKPAQKTASVPGPRDMIEPSTLISWILTGDRHVHLIDLRPEERFLSAGIRTAESMPFDSVDRGALRAIPSGHLVVIYGETDEEAVAAFADIKALHERTYILEGGYQAWRSTVLEAGPEPTGSDEDAWEAYRTRVALVRYLTGQSDTAPVPERRVVQPVVRPRIKVKNEGC